VSDGGALADGTITAADIGAQATLVSGTNIKTINGTSVLGSGNIQIDGGVTSFNTRTGAITLGSSDVTGALGFTPGVGDVTLTGSQTLTNKTLTRPVITQNVQVISTNTTAVASRTYVLTASLTLTLPASPAPGDPVSFSNRSGTSTPVIARNGQNIMSLAEDLTVDNVNYFATLVFADATRGWIFQ
jgi:hypothetical protein